MAKAKIIFTLDGVNSIIQCSTENKMKEICQNYATKINKKIDTLLFLYEGNQINFEQTFINQAISIDKNNMLMKGSFKIMKGRYMMSHEFTFNQIEVNHYVWCENHPYVLVVT